MRSRHSNYNQQPLSSTPLLKRRLKTKPVLLLLAILLFGNIFWFVLWLWPESQQDGGDEMVASIDGKEITRQQWMAAMETRYGKETLQILVNTAVMEKASKDYKIKVLDEEIDLEVALLRTAQDGTDTKIQSLTNEELRQEIRAQLILEKVLTKDIIINEDQVNTYYKENQLLYNIPTTYRTSIIVVGSLKEANRVLKELDNGSDFSVLAREHSLDTSSASLGGEIGFITTSQNNIDKGIQEAVKGLDMQEVSEPFVMSDGRYGVVMVTEINAGKSFTYEEVKGHIERVIALEQLPNTVTPEAFWEEFNVTWFYGEK